MKAPATSMRQARIPKREIRRRAEEQSAKEEVMKSMVSIVNSRASAFDTETGVLERIMRRAADVDNIARTDLGPGHCVSYISTPDPLDFRDRGERRRYEVAVFRPGEDTDIRHFATHKEGLAYYQRAVSMEQALITAMAAREAVVKAIKARQQKIHNRMLGRLNFTKRKIRVRREK